MNMEFTRKFKMIPICNTAIKKDFNESKGYYKRGFFQKLMKIIF